jgi:hypothetical protein
MATLYWVPGGSGTWSDSNNWASSSGGTAGVTPNDDYDAYVFDANSGTGTAQLGQDEWIGSIDCRGFTGTIDFQSYQLIVSNRLYPSQVVYFPANMAFAGTPVLRTSHKRKDGSGSSSNISIEEILVTSSPRLSLHIGDVATSGSTRSNVYIYDLRLEDLLIYAARSATLDGSVYLRAYSSLMQQHIYGDYINYNTNTYTYANTRARFKTPSGTTSVVNLPGMGSGKFSILEMDCPGGTVQLQSYVSITMETAVEPCLQWRTGGTLDLNDNDLFCYGLVNGPVNTASNTIALNTDTGSIDWGTSGTNTITIQYGQLFQNQVEYYDGSGFSFAYGDYPSVLCTNPNFSITGTNPQIILKTGQGLLQGSSTEGAYRSKGICPIFGNWPSVTIDVQGGNGLSYQHKFNWPHGPQSNSSNTVWSALYPLDTSINHIKKLKIWSFTNYPTGPDYRNLVWGGTYDNDFITDAYGTIDEGIEVYEPNNTTYTLQSPNTTYETGHEHKLVTLGTTSGTCTLTNPVRTGSPYESPAFGVSFIVDNPNNGTILLENDISCPLFTGAGRSWAYLNRGIINFNGKTFRVGNCKTNTTAVSGYPTGDKITLLWNGGELQITGKTNFPYVSPATCWHEFGTVTNHLMVDDPVNSTAPGRITLHSNTNFSYNSTQNILIGNPNRIGIKVGNANSLTDTIFKFASNICSISCSGTSLTCYAFEIGYTPTGHIPYMIFTDDGIGASTNGSRKITWIDCDLEVPAGTNWSTGTSQTRLEADWSSLPSYYLVVEQASGEVLRRNTYNVNWKASGSGASYRAPSNYNNTENYGYVTLWDTSIAPIYYGNFMPWFMRQR